MANPISLHTNNEILIIKINLQPGDSPTATIISYSGETIDQFYLQQGINEINIASFLNRNYSVRIKNGKNIVVRKI